MKSAIYPGSFDPLTNGHLDVIIRASEVFDLTILVAVNESKKSLLSVEDKVELIKLCVASPDGIGRIKVEAYDGLIADYCKQNGHSHIVRGLRPLGDFEKEYQMAQANAAICPGLDTVFFTATLDFISSSLVKEVWKHGGDISKWVPEKVFNYLSNTC